MKIVSVLCLWAVFCVRVGVACVRVGVGYSPNKLALCRKSYILIIGRRFKRYVRYYRRYTDVRYYFCGKFFFLVNR